MIDARSKASEVRRQEAIAYRSPDHCCRKTAKYTQRLFSKLQHERAPASYELHKIPKLTSFCVSALSFENDALS